MKLKDAIVLGIGFSIGKVIFSTVIRCIDNIVTFGNNVIDVMNNEELSFEESVDKVIKKRKIANQSKSIKELLDLLKKTQKSPKHGLFFFCAACTASIMKRKGGMDDDIIYSFTICNTGDCSVIGNSTDCRRICNYRSIW